MSNPKPKAPSLRTRLLADVAAGSPSYGSSLPDSSSPSTIGSPQIRPTSPTARPGSPGSSLASSNNNKSLQKRPTKNSSTWFGRVQQTVAEAEERGVKHPWLMYASYYIPLLAWPGQYHISHLLGDLAAGVTVASMYIPMALSLSANLAHLPPIHGLYGFAIQPLVYAVMGSCSSMVVGPEAAGSLLMGGVIRTLGVHHGKDGSGEEDVEEAVRVAGVVTFMAGAVAMVAGLGRVGFLDCVLSKPLLRGFVSGVGVVIWVDQLLPELGLNHIAAAAGITHASTVTKLIWLCQNFHQTHGLTAIVSLTTFCTILFFRHLKRILPLLHYFPDRLLLVILFTSLTSHLKWHHHGLQILGRIDTTAPKFSFSIPITPSHFDHIRESLSTSFLISVLGFFESIVASKSLGAPLETSISSNRELIALGTANLLGGCFRALPAFGGYGRSKVNVATGGRTPVSSIVLSACTILTICFLLPYLHFTPRAVLSAMISVVAFSLLEEAPHDIRFFLKIKAWEDLLTIGIVFLTTLLWSLTTGIAIGVGVSVIQVLRAATRAKIEILGRDPETGHWRPIPEEEAVAGRGELEQTPEVLVIKIRQSLTFANAGDLARRLWRIDRYGDMKTHPSMPSSSGAAIGGVRGVVVDCNGVDSVDGSGAMLVREICGRYGERRVKVWWARCGDEVWKRLERAGVGEFGGRVQGVEEGMGKVWRESESGRARDP